MPGPLRHRQISAAVEQARTLTRSGLSCTTLGAAALASTRGALEARLAGGPLLYEAFGVVCAATLIGAVSTPVAAVPIVLIAALAIAPAFALGTVGRSVGVFTAQAFGEGERILRLVEGGVGISIAVVDPGSGRLGVSAVRILRLGKGCLVRSLLLLLSAETIYEGARDKPGEDQERKNPQNRRHHLVVTQQAISDATEHHRHAPPGGPALGVQ